MLRGRSCVVTVVVTYMGESVVVVYIVGCMHMSAVG